MKQIILVNRALRLPRGKLAAQVAHAAVAAFLESGEESRRIWLDGGMPKVVLEVENEEVMLALLEKARTREIPNALIADAGRTVLPKGTLTCAGLGPAPDAVLDEITGDLKLLG